jgi:hypothetical protein
MTQEPLADPENKTMKDDLDKYISRRKRSDKKFAENFDRGYQKFKAGVPVADLVPHRRTIRTKAHPVLSKIKIGYNPVEPLSADEWPEAAR